MGSAIKKSDLAYSMLPAHKRRVALALEEIHAVCNTGSYRIGIGFSGGKDSTVLLDLIWRIDENIPAYFFDSGIETEYDETYAIVDYHNVNVINSELSLFEMCRRGGYWGCQSDEEIDFNFDDELIYKLESKVSRQLKINTAALGLRKGENRGREKNLSVRGNFYRIKPRGDIEYHFCPLANWTDDDIWGYIASRKLRYNSIYDKYAEAKLDRKEWRVCVLIGLDYATYGRIAFLKRFASKKYNNLIKTFPKLERYT